MLTPEERVQFRHDFHAYLRRKFAKSAFGYQSFPKLDYDQKVLSILIEDLKREGKIEGTDVFQLT